MLAKPIPVSGEMLPAIGIGTYKGFDLPDGEATRTRLAEVLRRLFAAGGAIVDSSPMYGRAEARAGQALASLGKLYDAFIMTKVWTSGGAAGTRQMRDSLTFFGVSASR